MLDSASKRVRIVVTTYSAIRYLYSRIALSGYLRYTVKLEEAICVDLLNGKTPEEIARLKKECPWMFTDYSGLGGVPTKAARYKLPMKKIKKSGGGCPSSGGCGGCKGSC
jgi:hypothetical protein